MWVSALVVVGFVSAAYGDPNDAAHAPGFVTLDRFDATTRFGVDAAYIAYEREHVVVSPHAQSVDADTGFGLYGRAPLTLANDSSRDQLAAELGIEFVVPGRALESLDLELVLHAGVVLGEIENTPRVPFGADLLFRQDAWFARLDIDPIATPRLDGVVLDGGIGYDADDFAVTAELRWTSAKIIDAAVALRGRFGLFQPYAAVQTVSLVESQPLHTARLLALVAGVEWRR